MSYSALFVCTNLDSISGKPVAVRIFVTAVLTKPNAIFAEDNLYV